MPENVIRLNVLVASPGDVHEERKLAEKAIAEVNASVSSQSNVILTPRMWECDATPQLGDSGQSVINSQFADDCDIVIGFFGTRIGTPAEGSRSGTVHEIERAIERWKKCPSSVRISLFFSKAPIDPYTIDREQFAALSEFRNEMEAVGLIKTYESLDEFELSLRQTLFRHVGEYGSKWGGADESDSQNSATNTPLAADEHFGLEPIEDVGFFDAMEAAGEYLDVSTSSITSIGESGLELGEKVSKATADLKRVDRSSSNARHKFKRIADRVATYLDALSDRFLDEAPTARRAFASAISYYSAGVSLAASIAGGERDELLGSNRNTMTTLLESLESAEAGMRQLSVAVADAPRLTTNMVSAKRRASGAVELVCEMVAEQKGLVKLVIDQIDDLLKN